MAQVNLTRPQKILVGIVLAGAVVIATIGFVGSYTAVRALAEEKGFGSFAPIFPVGIDAGIICCLALDILCTWLGIPFPLLRHTAWLLTAATIAFNGASAWGDPLSVAMHGIIPLLFVITVEAARHAIGRVTDITADRHMEGVRMWRWLLSPLPTARLWRRMKLWELRSYQEVIGMERDRLVYQAQLRAEYGRAWRRRAPVEARMPLKLARYGVPIPRQTAAATPPAAGNPEVATNRSRLQVAGRSEPTPLPPPIATRPQVATNMPPEQTTVPSPEVPPATEAARERERRPNPAPPAQREPQRRAASARGGNGGLLQDGAGGYDGHGGGNAAGNSGQSAGVLPAAERLRGLSVEVRLPAPPRNGSTQPSNAKDPDGPAAAATGEESQAAPQAEQMLPDYTGWNGREAVADAYARASTAERAMSARALAPILADRTRLKWKTVRVYLGEIRKAEKASTEGAAVATPDSAGNAAAAPGSTEHAAPVP